MHLIGIALGAYLLLTGAVFVMQRSLLYPGTRDRPDLAQHAAHGIEAVTTRTADGLELTHWYLPPPVPGGPVIVVFHGNAGHLGDRVPKLLPLAAAGYGLLLAGYRGYSGNPGQPTEAHLTADSRGLLKWLAERGTASDHTILYGESLGTGIAVKMAAEGRGGALVLESPYSSIADVAQMHYWYLPARWLILDAWNSLAHIGRVSAPLLVLHGAEDRTVPLRFGRALFDAAPDPKDILILSEAGHVDLLDRPHVALRVAEFLRAQVPPGQ